MEGRCGFLVLIVTVFITVSPLSGLPTTASSSQTGVPENPGTCNFEKADICTWTNDVTDQFDWTINQGSTLSLDTGPVNDFTLGNSLGHYIYTEASLRNQGDVARLISALIPPSQQPTCFSFEYSMYGQDIGTLNIYVKYGQVSTLLWTLSGNQSTEWKRGSFNLPQASRNQSSRIVIESIIGASFQGDVALDDLKLDASFCAVSPLSAVPGAANRTTAAPSQTGVPLNPATVSCDFEAGFCSWTQETDDQANWIRHQGSVASFGTGPSGDHTTGNSSGYYIYLESSDGVLGDKARILSGTVTPQHPLSCLSFWYYMKGSSIGSLNVYLRTSSQSPRTLLWSLSGEQGDLWIMASLNIHASTAFSLELEAVRGNSFTGDIAVDDIRLADGACTVSPPATANRTTAASSQTGVPLNPATVSCDFENGFCSWTQETDDQANWIRHQGSVASVGTGPSGDHTTGNSSGYYIYLESSDGVLGDKARILSGTVTPQHPLSCLSFWYYMRGSSIGSLNVYLRNSSQSPRALLWSKSGEQGNLWIMASLDIHVSTAFSLELEAVRGSSFTGDIAVDDIRLADGACRVSPPVTANGTTAASNQTGAPLNTALVSCNFETGFCSWRQETDDQTDWIRHQGSVASPDTGPTVDHTLGTSSGYYIYLESSVGALGDKARILSGTVTPQHPLSCLSFWYYMRGSSIGSLNVYLRTSSQSLRTLLWTRRGEQGNLWIMASISIDASTAFSLELEAVRGNSFTGDIAVDDIRLADGACRVSPPVTANGTTAASSQTGAPLNPAWVSCNFETGFCSWRQETDDQTDWIRHQGSVASPDTGPTVDHTLGTSSGYYIYLESSVGALGDKARILSGTVTPDHPLSCLSFWYYMRGSSIGSLNVYLRNSSQYLRTLLWSKSGEQGNLWIMASLDIDASTAFSLELEAVRGNSFTGDIAVDDIRLVDGACTGIAPAKTTHVPLSVTTILACDFESGTSICGFIQDIQDDFDWQITSGSTGSDQTGPISDHTLISPQGHYVFIDATNIAIGAKARLLTPSYNVSGDGNVCIRFFYYMYGDGVGAFNVYIKTTNQITSSQLIWSKTGNLGNYWILGQLSAQANILQSSYQVVFEGVRGTNYRADIAIDDVSITKGACPAADAKGL